MAFTTINVTGGNGYTLALGLLSDRNGYGFDRINPTTAHVTIDGLTDNNYGPGFGAPCTFYLHGTSSGNAVTGVISDGSGTISITKSNTSTWALADNNTYTGVTQISGGILSVSKLADGGTASGIGASTNDASHLVLDGGGQTCGQFDFLSDGTNTTAISYLGGIGTVTHDSVLFDISYTGNFGANSTIGGYDVVLTPYSSAIPEPGTWALMLGGLAGLFGFGHFRRQKRT